MTAPEKDTLVLVADDEPSTLALVASHVRSKGFTVLEASDGDHAWQLAHEHLPDLIILDVMMPGMSGWEVCRKVRDAVSLAHTGVIMLTGIGENLNEMTSPLYGADTYIDKPFEFSDLDVKIDETLARRREGALGRGEPEEEEAYSEERPPRSFAANGEAKQPKRRLSAVRMENGADRGAAVVKPPKPSKPGLKKARDRAEGRTLAMPRGGKKKAAKRATSSKGAPAKPSKPGRKAGAKKAGARKPAPKKAAKKAVKPPKQAAARKAVKKASAKKAPTRKASPRKAPARKAPAKKNPARKAPARSAPRPAPKGNKSRASGGAAKSIR